MSKKRGKPSALKLRSGSRIAVIGGGPAGSFFSYFLLEMGARVGLKLKVDIFEPKDFHGPGPAGCNHCGGIVSESLVQILAAEGINLPPSVVQRAIDSYMMHTDAGSVRIQLPLHEKRIAALFRGGGPKTFTQHHYKSFDGFLQNLAIEKGANVIRERVVDISWEEKKENQFDRYLRIATKNGTTGVYDLVAAAPGVNTTALKLFEQLDFGYRTPETTKTHIGEIHLGHKEVQEYFGNAMHVFLLDIPRLEFAALIPKDDYVTLCMLGQKIDTELVDSFLQIPQVRACFPPGRQIDQVCQCAPRINMKAAVHPFTDRLVMIGDSGCTRLYKDGIGAAFRTAKACAATAVFHGISADDFKRRFKPAYRAIGIDNAIGKLVFFVIRRIQKISFARRGIFRMVRKEQTVKTIGARKRMSMVLWDMFTGSAPYSNIFLRTLHPFFLGGLSWNTAAALVKAKNEKPDENQKEPPMTKGDLGKIYKDNQVIVRQGETGDCMYVVQDGEVEVFRETGDSITPLATLEKDDFFGEMALFEEEVRSATVRAKGNARVLTVDKKTLMARIQEDPSLAFRMIRKMSHRVRELDTELGRINAD